MIRRGADATARSSPVGDLEAIPLIARNSVTESRIGFMLTTLQVRFLRLCAKAGVRYVVVGGQAMRARGLDRATRDLDILLSPLVRDAEALLRALGAIDDRLPKSVPVSMLTSPLRRMSIPDADGITIDLLTSIEAIDFEQAYGRASTLRLDGCPCTVASVDELITAKRASRARCLAKASDPGLAAHMVEAYTELASRDALDVTLLEELALGGPAL